MTISGPAQGQLGGSVDVRVSGHADPSGNYLTIFDQPSRDACQATALDEQNAGIANETDAQIPAGAFARTVSVGLADPGSVAGPHRLCGYLLAQGSDGGYDYSDVAGAASTVVDEEPQSFFLHYLRRDELLMISVINDQRALHHLRRMIASARMRRIADHRFHEPKCPYDTLPGCDVIFDLHRAHICVRHAREYEFPVENDLSPDGIRAGAQGLFGIAQFRHDALLGYWREIGLAIRPQGSGLIIDFLDPC